MRRFTLLHLTRSAAIAALYAVLTMAFAFISFREIQFRVSEVLVLLAFIDPWYIPGLTMGCIIANATSPLGVVDVAVGTFATLLALGGVALSRKIFGNTFKGLIIASLMPVIFNAILVGAELYYLLKIPFLAAALSVAIGEFTVVTIAGVLIFRPIIKNESLLRILRF